MTGEQQGGAATSNLPAGTRPAERLVPGLAAGLDLLLGRLHRGPGDPTMRRMGRVWWRASLTPAGAALVQFIPEGADVRVRAWGEGSVWALDQAPRLLGADDHPDEFHTDHPVVAVLVRRHPWLRVGATDLVAEALLPSVLEQRVTGAEAFRSHRLLVRRHGRPAPGPAAQPGHPAHGMVVPPSAREWALIPSWEYLGVGVEQARSRTLVGAAQRARALEASLHRPDPGAALRSLPGIGPWTAARTLQAAHGDPDAWSTGDYHVPGFITHALVGEKLGQDDAEEVLAGFTGHRYRVELLVWLSGISPERHGPRKSLPTHLP
ncbi:MAG TPA: DNA-3-methyladenine glycosylase 2 family protein [Candidatus Luteococcus avicola]|nr:DNA-3-methyladenine glycosylase 2 family protein [Candidatus Luteococcus avicola]